MRDLRQDDRSALHDYSLMAAMILFIFLATVDLILRFSGRWW